MLLVAKLDRGDLFLFNIDEPFSLSGLLVLVLVFQAPLPAVGETHAPQLRRVEREEVLNAQLLRLLHTQSLELLNGWELLWQTRKRPQHVLSVPPLRKEARQNLLLLDSTI